MFTIKDTMWKYVVAIYITFWVSLIFIGGTASIILDATEVQMKFVAIICSWTPTITLLVLFKKFNPDTTIKEFYKKVFSKRINLPLF